MPGIVIPFELDDMSREVMVVLPDDWRQAGPLPVVFMLSGNNEHAETAANTTRFHVPAFQYPADADPAVEGILTKYITVYPVGAEIDGNSTWSNDIVNASQLGTELHDVELFQTILEALHAWLQPVVDAWADQLQVPSHEVIDTERLYLSGFSSGAFMAYKVAALNRNDWQFAAIGVHSGAIGGFSMARDGEGRIPTAGMGPVDHDLVAVSSNFSPQFWEQTALPIHIQHIHGLQDPAVPPVPIDPSDYQNVGEYSINQVEGMRAMYADAGLEAAELQEVAEAHARWQYTVAYGLNNWALAIEPGTATGTEFDDPLDVGGSSGWVPVAGGFRRAHTLTSASGSAVALIGRLVSDLSHEWWGRELPLPTATERFLRFFQDHPKP